MQLLHQMAGALLAATPLALLLVGLYYGTRLGWFYLLHPRRVLRDLFGRREEDFFDRPMPKAEERRHAPTGRSAQPALLLLYSTKKGGACVVKTASASVFATRPHATATAETAGGEPARQGISPQSMSAPGNAPQGFVAQTAGPQKVPARESAKGQSGRPTGAAPSPFRAASMAMAGTIGVGNMTGVALALLVGGPGAVFWMWVAAFCAMVLKYVEITLAMDSRRPGPGGEMRGGTPHAMRAGGWGGVAAVFAALCLLNTLILGGAVQANAVSDVLSDTFGIAPLASGLLLLLLVLPAILGRAERISALTARLVPVMCFLYLGAALWVLATHAADLPGVLSRILAGAFAPTAAGGGALGFLTARALRVGVARGLVSNEGGCGTAPLAHVTSGESVPARQGLWGIFEVFVDTVVICTLTAAVILALYPTLPDGIGGMALTRGAFVLALGPAGGVFVAVSLFLFAYATVLCEVFYGRACLAFFTESRPVCRGYLFFFCLTLLFGAVFPSDAVWGLTDLILAVMTWLNLAWLLKNTRRAVALTRQAGYLR